MLKERRDRRSVIWLERALLGIPSRSKLLNAKYDAQIVTRGVLPGKEDFTLIWSRSSADQEQSPTKRQVVGSNPTGSSVCMISLVG
jgi:hypothetical protein